MNQALLSPLDQIENSLTSLLTSLTTTNTYSAAPAAAQALSNADDALSSALVQLKQHQDNYTRILVLRAEADRLQTQLRDIVRTCVDLRGEIGQIHPSILEDTDEEDEIVAANPINEPSKSELQNKPVDYGTLLSFAARIGKHNAAAAVEAERQSNRRHRDTNQSSQQEANGNLTQSTQIAESTARSDQADGHNNTTQESLAELAAINDTLAQQRAYRGMAFPAAEALRMGELGRLQYIREQEGEDAVEREIERMIRESERVTPKEDTAKTDEVQNVSISAKPEPQPAQPERSVHSAVTQQQQRPPPPPPASLPPKPKKIALDLDFPDSDDDDDDD